MSPCLCGLRQTSFDGIVLYVSQSVPEMVIIADEAIMIIALPEVARAAQERVRVVGYE